MEHAYTSRESELFTTPVDTTKALLKLIEELPDPADVPAENIAALIETVQEQ